MRAYTRNHWILISLLACLSLAGSIYLPFKIAILIDLVLLSILLAFYYWEWDPKSRLKTWLEELNEKENLESVLEHVKSFPTDSPFTDTGNSILNAAEDHVATRLSLLFLDSPSDLPAFRASLDRTFQTLRQLTPTSGIPIMVNLLQELAEGHIQDMKKWERLPTVFHALPPEFTLVGKLAVLKWAWLLRDIASTSSFDERIEMLYQGIATQNPFDPYQQAAVFLQLLERKPKDETVSDMSGLRIATMFRTYWNFLEKRERQFVVQLGLSSALHPRMMESYIAYVSEFEQKDAEAMLAKAWNSYSCVSLVLRSVYPRT